jgi:hypothetical protein
MSLPFIALIVTMIAVLAVLFTGIFAIVRGGEFNRKYGNKLMRARVVLQGVAILLFIVVMTAGHKS